MKKVLKWTLITIGLIFSAIIAYGVILAIAFGQAMEAGAVTDSDQYTKVLSQWEQGNLKHLVQHFPRDIGRKAKIISFSSQQAFMQGGAYIQVRLKYDAKKIEQVYEIYKAQSVSTFVGGSSSEHRNTKDGMPTTNFYTNTQESDNSFPHDYEILSFDKLVLSKDSSGGYWNHGDTHGVAISKNRSEVIYWAESW